MRAKESAKKEIEMKMLIEKYKMEEIGKLVSKRLLPPLYLALSALIVMGISYISGASLYKLHYMAYYSVGFIIYFTIVLSMAKNSVKRNINHEINIENYTNFHIDDYKGLTPGTDWHNHELSQNGNGSLSKLALNVFQDKEVSENKKTFWHLRKVLAFLKVPMLESFESRHIVSRYALLKILLDEGYDVFRKGLDIPAYINGKKDIRYTWLFESFLSEWVDEYAKKLQNNFIFACNDLLAGAHGTQLIAITSINFTNVFENIFIPKNVEIKLKAIKKTKNQYEEFLKILKAAGLLLEFKKKSRWLRSFSAQLKNNQIYNSCHFFFKKNAREKVKNRKKEWVVEHPGDIHQNQADITMKELVEELTKYLSFVY